MSHANARTAATRPHAGTADQSARPGASDRTESARASAEAAADAGGGPGSGRQAAETRDLESRESNCVAPLATCGDAERSGADEVELARERRRARWRSRALLWRTSSLPGVRWCGRVPGVEKSADGEKVREVQWVDVRRNEQTAGYARLATCGSVWACPRCSAVIAVERSAEIGRAVEACHNAGGATYMVTLTMRHHAGHTLDELWAGLSEGWSKTFRDHEWTGVRGRWRKGKGGTDRWVAETVGDRDRFEVGGTVRCVEATFSRPRDGGNGWHLHAHVLLMTMGPFGEKVDPDRVADVLAVDNEYVTEEVREVVAMVTLGSRLFRRWIKGVTKAGLPAPSGAGLDIRRVEDRGADFIGNYLSKATLDVARKIGAEVGGGRNTKTVNESVEKISVTPFELLNDLTERHGDESVFVRVPNNQWTWESMPEGGSQIVDHHTGEIMEVAAFSEFPRWHEWEQGSRGRRQLLWSQRVKEPGTDREAFWNELLDARGREAKDEDIAAREIRGETVAHIHRSEWFDRMVNRPEWFTDLLEAVEDADDDESAAVAAQEWGVRHGVVVNRRSG